MGEVPRPWVPVGAVLRAARRPATYPAQVVELSSLVVTAGLWPFGLRDGGGAALVEPPAPGRAGAAAPPFAPVLLVHGWGGNRSNWWRVGRALRRAGFEHVDALNYNPFRPGADIASLAAGVARRARLLAERTGSPRVHLVGHSLGGVLARTAVQVQGLRGVDTCITVAAPHGGVALARCRPPQALRAPFTSGLELAPDSPAIRALRRARPLPTRFVAYYSNLDVLVPAARAVIVEPELAASNILIKDRGHLSILLSRALARSVVDQLVAAERRAAAGGGAEPEAAAA